MGGEKSLDGLVGVALEDDADGPDAEGGFDFALAFDVAMLSRSPRRLVGMPRRLQSWAMRVKLMPAVFCRAMSNTMACSASLGISSRMGLPLLLSAPVGRASQT